MKGALFDFASSFESRKETVITTLGCILTTQMIKCKGNFIPGIHFMQKIQSKRRLKKRLNAANDNLTLDKSNRLLAKCNKEIEAVLAKYKVNAILGLSTGLTHMSNMQFLHPIDEKDEFVIRTNQKWIIRIVRLLINRINADFDESLLDEWRVPYPCEYP
jgi:hypothetical protein